MKKKKEKKKKLEHIPKINRRLFKLWSEFVRSRVGFSCEYCGIKRGDINENGVKIKVDAHHLMNRNVKDCPLKWAPENGISLCPRCHKFSQDDSFHLNPVSTITWMLKTHPDRIDYVLKHYKTRINLQNRDILYEIESRLNEKKSLDVDKLLEMDRIAKETKTPDPIFEEAKPASNNPEEPLT